ncbi:DUF423 domain-containing protein [Ameyamaea chiangmaiensis]|uniref:DUF423 domain-containing protein n=2 Tax=Ameyamaea chiangmaiensis TaxID=442969 RepID=A0A850P7J4_9PROT|nr:DUF423 domain-containing protein [Ameyamaea chiangmaiensis]NVN40567.1 DUF423 domain-containing protein [Ameyamaea chiangmaiensis]
MPAFQTSHAARALRPGPAPWAALGAILACLGVIFGALVAHLPDRMFVGAGRAMAQSAVAMQMWHALALLVLGISGRAPRLCAGLAVGTVLFCAPVYYTALTGHHPGPIAPTGGVLLIASWAALAVVFLRAKRPEPS